MRTVNPNGSRDTRFVLTAAVGIVLAGGRSTRMGADKASLRIGGERLVDRAQGVLRSAFSIWGVENAVVRVSGKVEGCDCLEDRLSGLGPVGGIHSAAMAFPDSLLLFVPVDMPGLSSEVLAGLLEPKPSIEAVVFDGLELPLRLVASSRVREVLGSMMQADFEPRSRSIRTLLGRLEVHSLPHPRSGYGDFANANTPEDWRAFRGDGVR
jgi:molybdopterin-guanine dinucleotide biosynthesis protein A